MEDLKNVELPANLDKPQAYNIKPKPTAKPLANKIKPSVPNEIQGSGIRPPVKMGTKPAGVRPEPAKPTQDRSKLGARPAVPKKK